MIIKKIKHPYRDENISTNKDPENTSKSGKKLCFFNVRLHDYFIDEY